MAKGVSAESGRGCRFVDRTGQRNGRLVFTLVAGLSQHKHVIWEARCDCGATTQTTAPRITRSCGCLHREKMAAIQRAKALPKAVKLERVRANQIRQRARRKSDPLLAMQARMSRLFRYALSAVGAAKNSATFEMLGYASEDLVTHLERQFETGMGWDNADQWQIDHIIPSSEAKDVSDVIALNQLSNLRPMWADANNKKNNRRTLLL